MEGYLSELNDPQREAALHRDGALAVIAGAGAGKTRTIAYRIFHLIKNGVDPRKILAITFTNKAAQEMKERVRTLVGADPALRFPVGDLALPFMGTFHGLGAFILREQWKHAQIYQRFIIKDKNDSRALMKEAMKEVGIDPHEYEPRKILHVISKNKGGLVPFDEYRERVGTNESAGYFARMVSDVWERYEALLAKEHGLDFDDLLLKPYLLLKENEAIRSQYQNKWNYIHIDEYQDTNIAQYKLSNLLAEKHKNICIVGDVDQCIYGWRGARIQNLLRFEKDYPDAKKIFLEENYRSTGTILGAANEIIQKNQFRIPKNLFTANEAGEKISLVVAPSGESEARFVAETAATLIEHGVRAEGIAVLYRANFQSRALEEACLAQNIPYQVVGTRFFERKEIKDVMSYIRASLHPESLSDIKRIINTPPRGVGKVTLLKLFAGDKNKLPGLMQKKIENFYTLLGKIKKIAEEKTLPELVRSVLKETGLEESLKQEGREGIERVENIKELATIALRYGALPKEMALEKFLEDAALATDQDALLKEGGGVRLMTIHASKGLEFPYVFIVGLEQGLFPHERRGTSFGEDDEGEGDTYGSQEQQEEERRLFYVALTRAQKKLYLTTAETRIIFGSLQINTPSEFLGDIPKHLLDVEFATETEIPKTIIFD